MRKKNHDHSRPDSAGTNVAGYAIRALSSAPILPSRAPSRLGHHAPPTRAWCEKGNPGREREGEITEGGIDNVLLLGSESGSGSILQMRRSYVTSHQGSQRVTATYYKRKIKKGIPLWACACVLRVVRYGLFVLASPSWVGRWW